jgi:hypothetical protein
LLLFLVGACADSGAGAGVLVLVLLLFLVRMMIAALVPVLVSLFKVA